MDDEGDGMVGGEVGGIGGRGSLFHSRLCAGESDVREVEDRLWLLCYWGRGALKGFKRI